MKPDLAGIAAPGHTAIVTQECQGAVVGLDAGLAVLAEEARREALPNIERLLLAARDAGVKVVHCLVQRRPDGLGATDLDAILRNLGVSTIVAVGVSVNVAIIDNTLSLLATITTTDDLLRTWT